MRAKAADMNTETMLIFGGVFLVAALAVALGQAFRVRRTHGLRERFGPEYDRAVETSGGRGKAETSLQQREKRVDGFDIRPLNADERGRYLVTWRGVQSRFVDDPANAVIEADQVLGAVMSTVGYPVGDFDQRSSDLSVDHSEVIERYRAAHDIALRQGRGEATTEDLRQAMIHYRALFDDLTPKPDYSQRAAYADHRIALGGEPKPMRRTAY